MTNPKPQPTPPAELRDEAYDLAQVAYSKLDAAVAAYNAAKAEYEAALAYARVAKNTWIRYNSAADYAAAKAGVAAAKAAR